MVYDEVAHLGKTVNVCLAAAEVSSLYRINEQAIDGIVVVLVVLCCIDTSLSCNGMRSSWGIADAEDFYIVTHLSERGCGGCSGKSRSHNNDLEFSLVGRAYNLDFRFTLLPFFRQRTVWNMGYKFCI